MVDVARDAHERVGLHIEVVLEGDDDRLEARGRGRPRLGADVLGHARHVGCVQRRVDLIQHEERRRMVRVDRE